MSPAVLVNQASLSEVVVDPCDVLLGEREHQCPHGLVRREQLLLVAEPRVTRVMELHLRGGRYHDRVREEIPFTQRCEVRRHG